MPFSAELAARPAGVYRADVTINRLATKIGWAVLPDGTQVGLAVAGGASHRRRRSISVTEDSPWAA